MLGIAFDYGPVRHYPHPAFLLRAPPCDRRPSDATDAPRVLMAAAATDSGAVEIVWCSHCDAFDVAREKLEGPDEFNAIVNDFIISWVLEKKQLKTRKLLTDCCVPCNCGTYATPTTQKRHVFLCQRKTIGNGNDCVN